MTNLLKSAAIISLMATASASAPAFAAAHLDVNSMTCEEYNQLSGADRDKVAMMAIAELNDNGQVTDGEPKATAASNTQASGESTGSNTVAKNDGEATATDTSGAGNDESRMAEEIGVLNRTCARNWDAMVTEAAIGGSGR